MACKEIKAQLILAAVEMAAPLVAKVKQDLALDPTDKQKELKDLYDMSRGIFTACYDYLLLCLETDGKNPDGSVNDFRDPAVDKASPAVGGLVNGLPSLVNSVGGVVKDILKP